MEEVHTGPSQLLANTDSHYHTPQRPCILIYHKLTLGTNPSLGGLSHQNYP
jgi:hypothetical protein